MRFVSEAPLARRSRHFPGVDDVELATYKVNTISYPIDIELEQYNHDDRTRNAARISRRTPANDGQPAMEPLKLIDPRRIGEYQLSRRLGAGGMGEVFFGRSLSGRPVAVKLIYSSFANFPEFRRRFRLEVEASRKVDGFYTAPVVGADTDADRPWMATAYVQGPNLNQVLSKYRPLPVHSVRVLGAGLAEALKSIHAAGIIHRDLKPSNILLADDGPRVIDFGIARAIDASGTTARPGTPGFMAPEILNKQPVTTACDVFALGMVLAAAGGIRPFGPPDGIDYRVAHEEPDLRGLDPLILGLVAECLAKSPSDRPEPAEILERLAVHGSDAVWLPGPVRDMITACAPPREDTVDVYPLDHARLLAEADETARALPDNYERAVALVHIAAAVCRFDAPHATRLLDDALYPGKRVAGLENSWRRPLLEYLIESSAAEVGAVAARMGPAPAAQMLADITECSDVLTHRRMGVETQTANMIITMAKAAAGANPDLADRLTESIADESLRTMAVASVAMVLAHTEPYRAEKMTRAITSRIDETTLPPLDQTRGRRRGRLRPESLDAGTRFDCDTARYWAVRALAAIAVAVGGADPFRTGMLQPDTGHFARTITAADGSPAGPPSPVKPAPRIDPARAEQYLADAEHLAWDITASNFTTAGVATDDLRAGALSAVKTAAARIDSVRAPVLLAAAEQTARAIGSDSYRFEALAQVALAAASTDPVRAEQIAPSLRQLPLLLGDLALATAHNDPARAGRIADVIKDDYLRALARFFLTVQAAPDEAEPLLREVEKAARGMPARMVEIAAVAARVIPARAEQIARSLTSGPEIVYIRSDDNDNVPSLTTGYRRSAEYWKTRALTDLAAIAYEKTTGRT
jgi:hypothetical protein